MKKIKIGVVSLGCPKNLVDTRNILRQLPRKYFDITGDVENSDIMLLNTCTFIDEAKKENLDVLNELIGYKKIDRHKKLIVTGCMVERYYSKLKAYFPEVDAFFRISDEKKIASYIIRTSKLSSAYTRIYKDLNLTPPHYTYVKIAEGCDEKCSFCVIPKIRGKFRSRPVQEIKDEVRQEVQKGITEIILVAQDLLYYGHDIGESIYTLLDELTRLRGNFQIRLLYLNINLITKDFVQYVLDNPKIINYFDIPLQHVDPRILKMMNKPTDSAQKFLEIKEFVSSTREPHIFRSSFIIGFPGETAREFNQILEFLARAQLDNAGFFRYSHEEGSDAFDRYEDNITERTKNMRLKKAYRVQHTILHERLKGFVNKKMDCIIDGPGSDGAYIGRIIFYDRKKDYIDRPHYNAPEIDYHIIIRSRKNHFYGDKIPVKITGLEGIDLYGEAL